MKKQSSMNIIPSGDIKATIKAKVPSVSRKESNKVVQITLMGGGAGPSFSARQDDDEDESSIGRKFHFPMRVGDLLEPAYFNKKNKSLSLAEAKKLQFLGANLIKNTNPTLAKAFFSKQ